MEFEELMGSLPEQDRQICHQRLVTNPPRPWTQ
jgi:hypothetical protein